jgi:hypothetical protein
MKIWGWYAPNEKSKISIYKTPDNRYVEVTQISMGQIPSNPYPEGTKVLFIGEVIRFVSYKRKI